MVAVLSLKYSHVHKEKHIQDSNPNDKEQGDFRKGLQVSGTVLCFLSDSVKMFLPPAEDELSSLVKRAPLRPRSPGASAKATAICC